MSNNKQIFCVVQQKQFLNDDTFLPLSIEKYKNFYSFFVDWSENEHIELVFLSYRAPVCYFYIKHDIFI